MVGKLTDAEMAWYYLLKGEIGILYQTLTIHDQGVEVQMSRPKLRRKLSLVYGQPVLRIELNAKLQILHNNQDKPLTLQNLDEIERKFKQTVEKKASDFLRKRSKKVGTCSTLKRKSGEAKAKSGPRLSGIRNCGRRQSWSCRSKAPSAQLEARSIHTGRG